MSEKKLYPLSLSVYYLNFSYPGHFNLQSRVFLTLPCAGQSLDEDSSLDYINICFEMNSAFALSGLKMMIDQKSIEISNTDIRQEFVDRLDLQDANKIKTFFFENEDELYLNLNKNLKEFLDVSYEKDWAEFYIEKRQKYDSTVPAVFKVKDTTNIELELISEKERNLKFTNEIQEKMTGLLNASVLDDDMAQKLHLSIDRSGLLSKMLGSAGVSDRQDVSEINKMLKLWQYYELSTTMPNDNIKIMKPKKI